MYSVDYIGLKKYTKISPQEGSKPKNNKEKKIKKETLLEHLRLNVTISTT